VLVTVQLMNFDRLFGELNYYKCCRRTRRDIKYSGMDRYKTKIKVRYAETDRMGVVYHSNFFIWFEVARTEFLDAMGISYRELEEKQDVHLMVVSCFCQYRQPATYDDEVTLETWVSEKGKASVTFQYEVYLHKKHIASGKTVHVFTNKKGKPIKMPEEFITAVAR